MTDTLCIHCADGTTAEDNITCDAPGTHAVVVTGRRGTEVLTYCEPHHLSALRFYEESRAWEWAGKDDDGNPVYTFIPLPPAPPGTCGYVDTEERSRCGEPATLAVVIPWEEGAVDREERCDRHGDIAMRALGMIGKPYTVEPLPGNSQGVGPGNGQPRRELGVRFTDRLPPPAERKRIRVRAGLTQRELARRLGISASYMSRIEGGTRLPDGNLDEYARVLRELKG